jgi:hypothetical protein
MCAYGSCGTSQTNEMGVVVGHSCIERFQPADTIGGFTFRVARSAAARYVFLRWSA